ncbi:hypothetical protein HAX54_035916 [Datura stramonium]|uniref:Uncharacterized protein n=1 Tax=Datura stramonium TaxID=4076 RepID=A0ABS8VG09_DATST|nr:hypothetical protein [Datura stramonium]
MRRSVGWWQSVVATPRSSEEKNGGEEGGPPLWSGSRWDLSGDEAARDEGGEERQLRLLVVSDFSLAVRGEGTERKIVEVAMCSTVQFRQTREDDGEGLSCAVIWSWREEMGIRFRFGVG